MTDCKNWLAGVCPFKVCSFKHDPAKKGTGPPRKITNKHCKHWLNGLCLRRDEACLFQHYPEKRGQVIKDTKWKCPVCYTEEIPNPLPVLSNCSHWVCQSCIDKIRSKTKDGLSEWRPGDSLDDRGLCPVCQSKIYFVMQADRWPTGSTEHKKIIDGYLRESKKKPCEDFRASIQLWSRSGDRNLLYCRRGNACHYSHKLPGTEGPYIFPKGRIIAMVADRMDRGRTAAVAAQPSYPDRLDGETKEAYLTRLQKIEMAHIMRQDARERQRLEEHRERPLSLEFPE